MYVYIYAHIYTQNTYIYVCNINENKNCSLEDFILLHKVLSSLNAGFLFELIVIHSPLHPH